MASYTNIGTERATSIEVAHYGKSGKLSDGYPKVYNLTSYFEFGGDSFPSLSDTLLSRLKPEHFDLRVQAFYGYLQEREPLFIPSETKYPERMNEIVCPVPEEE